MKRKIYQAPQTKIWMLNLQVVLQGTNDEQEFIFDPEDGTTEALSKQHDVESVWDDAESEDYE